MTDERDLARLLRGHLDAEADALPFEVDAARVRERLGRRRTFWRQLALVPMAVMAVVAVIAGSTLLAGPGPDPSTTPSGSTKASASTDPWGPLAVAPWPASGDFALSVGTLRITGACVFLETPGDELALLVWPEDQTRWDASAQAITYTNFDGSAAVLRDGDPVSFSGGGDSTREGGVTGAEWVAGVEWVAEPDASCPLEVRWFIGDVVDSGAGTKGRGAGVIAVTHTEG